MLKTHEKFHSANGKRQVLIVDDEMINRELLKLVLEDDYETFMAPDGETALEIVRERRDTLSLILLDLLMPGMHGLDVIRTMKEDPELKHIPIIVLTADQKAEVRSLKQGASDFISKPYPDREVILARVMRCIELSEDRDIIQSTERDDLTGLYNREYFYRYAQQYDLHHREEDMDAIVVDAHHFRMINERYGKARGDEVLRGIGEKIRDTVRDSGGIVCRREADTFLIYCPHREDYQAILDNASIALASDTGSGTRVRLRMGVYPHVDKGIDMERRFDRAKMAADTVRNNYINSVALYDDALRESEVYAERLLEDFQDALAQHQFKVFYQPKFDIRPEIPVLASAEALVRWVHPELGFISPGSFIPLFEENGLIQKLDLYVWRETAAQIRDWKERLGICVPVSVNVSRVDMYDPNLIETFQRLLEEFGLTPEEMLLEITESAYTEDSNQIISTVNRLRDLGFRVEMDDFGTGYSSLNMISSLPIDALKLDMKFIRNAFRDGRDTRMIEVIIDIADYLGVPVIAEGVETEEQLNALKVMGCDMVQGYYFSKPVPAPEYEPFIAEKKQRQPEAGENSGKASLEQELKNADRAMPNSIAHALTSGFEVIYYVDTSDGRYVQFSAQGKYEDLQIERSGSDFFGDTQRNIPRVVYKEDQERVSLCMQREALLAQLIGGRAFTMTYRLVIGGEPLYYNLRAVKAITRDNHHIVIGVSNVEDQIRQVSGVQDNQERNNEFFAIAQDLELGAVGDDRLTYARIAQALSQDYFSIYYVNTETERFVEYSTRGATHQLTQERTGESFFEDCKRSIPMMVLPEDQPRALAAFDKQTLLREVENGKTFSIAYRLIVDGVPIYASLKALRLRDDPQHIIVGISNIDEQMQREQEYEKTKRDSVTFSSIAQALAADYFSIYYVNTETDRFIEYSAHDDYETLGIEKGGEDFFTLSRKNILRVVHPEDHEKILSAFTKEKLLAEMNRTGTFTLTYRLMFDGKPNYVSMKATRMEGRDDNHVVIGVNNINAQMQRQLEYDAAKARSDTYSRIARALSKDYYSIYLVNTQTDEFIEYSSNTEYRELQVEQNGVDFFKDCRRNVLRLVYKEDLEKALAVWDKERLMPELEGGKTFSTTYRLMFDGVPVYINCKVIRLEDDLENKYIVIGVSNVDAQMKREQELTLVREKANRDAMTGVKSKHAYMDAVEALNTNIQDGTVQPFAVVVCDVNGLKKINDTLGHQAGDKLIMDASHMICETFHHSPVFRVGGDEFVAILKGQDYAQRTALMSQMAERNRKNQQTGGVVIACGYSEWHNGEDDRFEAVFDRADNEMYENKTALKAQR